MKSFKQYLIESKKTYDFKVKIAKDVEEAQQQIKLALEKYQVESCSSGKRTPIQESPLDFPEHHNVNITVFDVSVAYPVNSLMIREAIAEKLGLSMCCIKVRNLKEEEEETINHQYDELKSEALLGKDYESTKSDAVFGDKHNMSLLKELGKEKHRGEQYKGVNDELLAKSCPSETTKGPAAKDSKINNKSPVGSQTVKLPTAKTAGGR